MKTSLARRLYRRSVIAAKRIRKIQDVRIELGQRPARTGKIKQNVVIASTQQDWPVIGIHTVQEMSMRLEVEHVADLVQFRKAHKLQRFRIPLLRVTLDT